MTTTTRVARLLPLATIAVALLWTSVAVAAPDADGDGVRDRDDRCPDVYSEHPSGCPAYELTMYGVDVKGGRHPHFEAWLGSSGGCHDGVIARLYERVPGEDRLVGARRTMEGSADGYFYIGKRLSPGSYYVEVRRHVVAERALCLGFTSQKVRVHR